MHRRVRPVATLAAGLALALATACTADPEPAAGGDPAPTTAAGGASTTAAAETAAGRLVSFPLELDSAQRILRQVGPDAQRNYGWNQLVGPTTVDGAAAQVEMLGNVDYTAGSGPFFGFVTLIGGDGSLLSFRMDGEATQAAGATGTADASFVADLTVIGGTGTWAGATGGTGTFTGSRRADLGGRVTGTVEARVAGL